jgi:hypothetical protein
MKKQLPRWKRVVQWILGVIIVVIVVLLAIMVMLSKWPIIGAHGADVLRTLFGDKTVAAMETGIYSTEDTIKQWADTIGFTPRAVARPVGLISVTPSSNLPAAPGQSASTVLTVAPWIPPALTPISTIKGEGSWSPYLNDSAGHVVAYLTSFQPDPKRDYTVAAAVAFDLNTTKLHFVLGTTEPYSPNSAPRSGAIPASDRVPGVLLAMFNGGFKAHQGMFGAMANGEVALPPKDGLGTLAIDQNGNVSIGAWGKDINATTNWAAWRQNGPLIIHQGAITPKVSHPLPTDWGDTVGGTVPVWRSGIGLSADGKTLYYVCGPSLTVEALANSLLALGAANAMQLDINNYWVHFVGVTTDGSKLILHPLFPAQMKQNIDRYLWHYERDYFYVTSKP